MTERLSSDRHNLRYEAGLSHSYCPCARRGHGASCRCGEDQEHLDWTWDADSTTSDARLQHEGKEVIFHPNYSSGTAAIRSTEGLSDGQHYWEVKMSTPVYGTDMMVGVGTQHASLNHLANKFDSLLGADRESWGLSYQGTIHHNGERERYTPYRIIGQGSIIGLYLDTWLGHLSFFLNRQPLGLAFNGLGGKELFPIVTSTAARSGMKVVTTHSHETSLFFMCARTLRRCVPHTQHVADALPLPPGLALKLRQKLHWLLRPHPNPYPARQPMALRHACCQCNNATSGRFVCDRFVCEHLWTAGQAQGQGSSRSYPQGDDDPSSVLDRFAGSPVVVTLGRTYNIYGHGSDESSDSDSGGGGGLYLSIPHIVRMQARASSSSNDDERGEGSSSSAAQESSNFIRIGEEISGSLERGEGSSSSAAQEPSSFIYGEEDISSSVERVGRDDGMSSSSAAQEVARFDHIIEEISSSVERGERDEKKSSSAQESSNFVGIGEEITSNIERGEKSSSRQESTPLSGETASTIAQGVSTSSSSAEQRGYSSTGKVGQQEHSTTSHSGQQKMASVTSLVDSSEERVRDSQASTGGECRLAAVHVCSSGQCKLANPQPQPSSLQASTSGKYESTNSQPQSSSSGACLSNPQSSPPTSPERSRVAESDSLLSSYHGNRNQSSCDTTTATIPILTAADWCETQRRKRPRNEEEGVPFEAGDFEEYSLEEKEEKDGDFEKDGKDDLPTSSKRARPNTE